MLSYSRPQACRTLSTRLPDKWHRETGKKAVISYAASNTLIKRIEQGAPADIFFSADLDWMDYGQQKDLIKPDTRFICSKTGSC
jgi:molybdenum ABC transporter molybdate-binding protein